MSGPSVAERAAPRFRLMVLQILLVMVALAGLIGRCAYLQIRRQPFYTERCLRQQRSLASTAASRGVILDARGRVLAASNQVRTIYADPGMIVDPKETATRLAGFLDRGAHLFCKDITDHADRRYVKLWTGATYEQSRLAQGIPGVGVQFEWQRYYPLGPLTSHAVGFVSSDNHGQGGIEYQYDRELQGEPARFQFLVDHRRRPVRLLAQAGQDVSLGEPGQGILLTLDATVQQFAREELSSRIREYEAESGIAIVAEPRSGAILAMVSLPDFEPTEAGHSPVDHLRNRAITDMYEPGSILKPIVAAIALDAGVLTKTDRIDCEHGDYRGRGFGHIGEYGDHAYGSLTIKEILVHSSNIGMAKVGRRLGPRALCEGLRLFGFGAKTGIPLPGEATGLMIPASQLKLHSLVRVPFGHAISVTGIQMVRAFCVLANGGTLVRPHLVKSFVDERGKPVQRDSAYHVAGQVGVIIDPDLAHWMVNDALRAVVANPHGTGHRARIEGWHVFGKTGTAQVPKADSRGYEDGSYIASFIAGAPAEDPALIVLVSIRKPNRHLGKGYTGGTVSAPVVHNILERSLTYLVGRGAITPPAQAEDPADAI